MNQKIFYKKWQWWYYLFLFALLSTFLLVGLYFCLFVDFWYVRKFNPHASLLNFDVLMSFLSVQVNIITIVWLIFIIFRYTAKNSDFLKNEMQTIVLNWNLLVFVIFWVGIVWDLSTGGEQISSYPGTQIACTAVTHFFCPLFLIVIYFFESGKKKYFYGQIYKKKEIYLTVLYPFCYLIFVLFRGAMYKRDQVTLDIVWPYPFLDFDNLLVGDSLVGYLILLILVFVGWLLINHLVIISVNNFFYKKRQAKGNKIKTPR